MREAPQPTPDPVGFTVTLIISTKTTKLEFLAQLFSVTADERPRERARALLESMRQEAARAVAELEAIDARMQEAPGYPEAMPTFLFYPWLTLRHGLIRRRGLLEWIDESLELLGRSPAPAGEDADPAAMSALVQALQEALESLGRRRSGGPRC